MNGVDTPHVTVLAFGPLAEELEWKRKTCSLKMHSTVREMVDSLGIREWFDKGLLCAINGTQCTFETELQPNDELALLPPVSGG